MNFSSYRFFSGLLPISVVMSLYILLTGVRNDCWSENYIDWEESKTLIINTLETSTDNSPYPFPFLEHLLNGSNLSFSEPQRDITDIRYAMLSSTDNKQNLSQINPSTRSVITIGTSTAGTMRQLPIDCNLKYNYTQSIYLQSEINTAGNIDAIAFQYNGSHAFTEYIVVYIGHTTKSSFNSNSDWIGSGSMQNCYSGYYYPSTSAGWHTITLSNPFTYNNSNNLVIAFDSYRYSGTHYNTDFFYTTSQGTNRSIYYANSITNPSPSNPPTATARSSYCSNVQLTINSAPPVITDHPDDANVTVGNTAIFTITATGSGLSYQWKENNVNISGATNSSYTTPATTLGDDGDVFKCVVTNSGGSVTSNEATLNVNSANNSPLAGSGDCLNFDGTSDYVSISSSIISGSTWTLEFWIKPNSVGDNDRIFIQGSGALGTRQLMAVWDNSDDQIEFKTSTSGTSGQADVASSTITDDNSTWTHVAWTSNNDVYINGTSSTGSLNTSKNYGIGGNTYIGCREGSSNMFNGYLDEVRVWNVVKSQSDIQANMYRTLDSSSTDANNLMLYYRFDEGSGSTVKDNSDTQQNGTITGATYTASEAWKNRATTDDTPLTFCAGYDPDEDAVTLSQTVAPSNGDLSFDNPDVEITYTPDNNFSGTDNFTFQISDGTNTDTYAMSVTVTNVNSSPVAGSGDCLNFDGGTTDDHVMVAYASSLAPTSAITLEFWAYDDDWENTYNNGDESLVSKTESGGYCIWIDETWLYGYVRRNGAWGAPTYSVSSLSAGWHHLAVTYDGRYTKLYVDGDLKDTDDAGSSYSITYAYSNALIIGGEAQTGTSAIDFFNGNIDEVRIWNSARTQTEIQEKMYVTLAGSESNLVGYWRFDEGSGSTVYDETAIPQNGTLVDMESGDWVASEAWKNRVTDEDDPLNFCVGYDPDDDALSFSTTVEPLNGILIYDTAANEITYFPDINSSGADNFTFQISDGSENDSYAMTVTTTNVNMSPVAGSGNCLSFDGDNDYIMLPNHTYVSDYFTLEFWIKPNSTPNYDRIFLLGSTGGATRKIMAFWYDDHVEFRQSSTGADGTAQIASGSVTDNNSTWTHIAWTYDNGSHTVYVNGQSSTSTIEGSNVGMAGNNYIGARDVTNNNFTGSLDEVRLWNDVRSQTEIQDNRYTALAGNEANLVGYWRFDESADSYARDCSGDEHHGILKNMFSDDWVNCNTWKYRTMATSATLSHSAGYDPDGTSLNNITEVTGPSAGTLTFDVPNEECDYTATATPATITYTYQVTDGTNTDDYDMEIEVEGQENYNNWNYSKRFYLNTTPSGADVENDVYNFPLLIRLDTTNFDFSEPLATGFDIRFAKSDITQHLSFERERWSITASDSVAEFWVRVDTVQGNNNSQYIQMFWGKAGASDESSGSDVFKTEANYDFAGVWHLVEEQSGTNNTDVYKDATANNNDGDDWIGATDQSGNIAQGHDFDGADDYVSVPDAASLDITSQITLSAWINADQWETNSYEGSIICKDELGPDVGYALRTGDNGKANFTISNGLWKDVNSSSEMSTDTWYYLTGTYDGTYTRIYINGVIRDSNATAAGGIGTNNYSLNIGRSPGATSRIFQGKIDEARVSNTTRSADWIKLCYENQCLAQTLVRDETYSDWDFTTNWTINTSDQGANVTGTVTDFPLLIRLNSGNFTFGDAQSNGEDLRFSRSVGSADRHLYYEIERWDGTNDSAEIWVRVDTIYGSNSSQYITMHWGNSGTDVRNRSRGDRVFDVSEGFAGVWYITEEQSNTGNPGIYKDATLNANNGNDEIVLTSQDGLIAQGHDFNGVDDYIEIPNSSSTEDVQESNFTLSGWLNADQIPPGTGSDNDAYYMILGKDGYHMGIYLENDSTFNMQQYIGAQAEIAKGASKASSGTFYYVVGVVDMEAGWAKVYVNGEQDGTESWTGGTAAREYGTTPFRIGITDEAHSTWRWPADGKIDEARVVNKIRSADWIKLCYETQKSDQIAVTPDEIELLPLTVNNDIGSRGTSDTVEIYTDEWKIIFDEDIGGGIKWLSYEKAGAGVNQLDPTSNLFYLKTDNTLSSGVSGELKIVESNSLLCNLQQTFSLNSHLWLIDYTVYGSGRIYIRVETEALGTAYDPAGGLEFRVETDVSNKEYVPENTTANQTNYILHADKSSGKYDVMLAIYEDWTDASGYTSSDSDHYGIIDSDWDLSANTKGVWEFMLDFGHRKWNDTSGIGKLVDDYRDVDNRDSLVFTKGTLGMEKAWEHQMVGHWTFDENSSGDANGDTAFDYSPTTHYGVINGCDWGDGKLNNGLILDGANDSVKLTTPETFDKPLVFTICAWIKKDGTTETNALIFGKHNPSAGEGYKLTSETDKLKTTLYDHSLTGKTSLGTDWHHVAVTYNKHQGWLKLFVDGLVDAITQIDPIITASSIKASIGNDFDGTIDDVRFYNEAISEETIRAIAKNGFRVNAGQFILRADNSNTLDFTIDGSSAVPEYFPIFQIGNYWATHTPYAVYYNGSRMTSPDDYITGLNDVNNILYIGFNKKVTTEDLRIYIDDTDSTGACKIGPMPSMVYGNSGSDYYVQNFTGSTFGASGSNEFYLYWKMDNTASGMGGELTQFKSSEISPSTAISSAANLCPTDTTYGTFGYFDHSTGSGGYARSMSHVAATPSYTVLEASDVRVRLQIDKRDVNGHSHNYDITTIWTIYPTGQIFRYDTVDAMSTTWDYEFVRFRQIHDDGYFKDSSTTDYRGVMYGCDDAHDYTVALLKTADDTGCVQLFTGYNNIAFQSNGSNYMGWKFDGKDDRSSTYEPYKYAFYLDIQHMDMDGSYMDSVCDGVQKIDYTPDDFITGERVDTTQGDLDTNGFNESEGAYVMRASLNSINFLLEADETAGDEGCRFYPALRILNYTAPTKPKYVHLYNSSDTITLLEGYGYNCYLNDSQNELIMQIDSVLCADTKIFLSEDKNLAVGLTAFYARPGDGKDTVFWRTESESENLGFNLYRRIHPGFMGRLTNAMSAQLVDSTLDGPLEAFKKGTIDFYDTSWAVITETLIPGAEGGTSVGPRDYSKIDYEVINDVLYEYKLESVSFSNTREFFGPIQVRPRKLTDNKKHKSLVSAIPNPISFKHHPIYFIYVGEEVVNITLQIFDPLGNLLYKNNSFSVYENQKFDSWNLTNRSGRIVGNGAYLALIQIKNNKKRITRLRLMIGVID